MIACSIVFTLPYDSDWDALRQRAVTRAKEVFLGLKGLHSKAFILDTATGEYGGMYVWDTRDDLDSFLKSELFTGAVAKLGEPVVKVYEIMAFIEDNQLKA